MIETPLDRAHAAMVARPEDDTARLRFFERLGDAELLLLLESEADGEFATPQTFETGGETLVLVFDRAERLAEFVGAEAPYVGLSGRSLADLLAGEGLGLALNPDCAPSSFVLDRTGVGWLADMLRQRPEEVEARFDAFTAPGQLPQVLLEALDQKLAAMSGLAKGAFLVGTERADGGRGHLLAFIGAPIEAEAALAQAMGEALSFTGLEAGVLDVAFFAGDDPVSERLARVGLRFDIPQVDVATAPGMDPQRPPILK